MEAQAYLAAQAPSEARRWLSILKRKLKSLERYPRRCGKAPEAADVEELRQLILGDFRVVVLIEQRRVYVLTVRRSARLPLSSPELQRRMLERSPRYGQKRRATRTK